MPLLDVDDAVAELQHAAEIGLHVVSLPTGVPAGHSPDWNRDESGSPSGPWPRRRGMVVAFHIGSDPVDLGTTLPPVRAARSSTTRDHLHRPAGRHQARRRGALDRHPTSSSRVRRRLELGAVPRRPHERGLPPARHVGPPKFRTRRRRSSTPRCTRRSARRLGVGGRRRRLPERDVGQRLPAPRGYLRAHPGDAARAVRRSRPGCAERIRVGRSRSCSRT